MAPVAPALAGHEQAVGQSQGNNRAQDIGLTPIVAGTVVAAGRSESVNGYTAPETATTTTVAWASARLEDDVPVQLPSPIRIAIPVLEIDAPVVALGVTPDNGQMEVPENVDEVGWYRHGPTPGLSGSAVLAAHVDMYGEGPGVFFHIDRLRSGDQIDVTRDDGTVMTFIVTTTERVPKAALDLSSIFASEGQPLLRLVTCGGGFNRTIRSYEDNVVITAQLEDA